MPSLRLLHVGDVVGEPGVQAVQHLLPSLRHDLALDFVTLNAENAHEGRGLNERQLKRMFKAGVDVFTGGDHSFDKHLIFPYLNKEPKLLRPINYPKGVPGHGSGVFAVPELGVQLAVLNIRGNTFFHNPIGCPFRAAEAALRDLRQATDLVFIDFHAEATAEKVSMAWHLDGKASAIAGTHTHVQTADERIFPQGLGFISDVGFTGAHNSVIGMDIQVSLERALMQIPRKSKLGRGDVRLQGAIFEMDITSGRCISVKRISVPCPEEAIQYDAEPDEPNAM
jgi:metallophosphoesterase (TIGR00282 family)